MKLTFRSEALRELQDVVAYLEGERAGLGKELLDDFDKTLTELLEYPLANPIVGRGQIRKKNLSRFRYGILYRVLNNEMLILVFMHLHRRPGYWRGRL